MNYINSIILVLLLMVIKSISYSIDNDDAEKYNVGGVLSDYESEKHFRLTISVSKLLRKFLQFIH